MRYLGTLLLGSVVWLGVCTPLAVAADVDPSLIIIKETVWGFDNAIPRRTFLPVSFLVQNTSPATATITLRLTRLVGFSKPIGTILQQEVTLAGESERWVQFVPYVEDENETWTLAWGKDKAQEMTLPQAMAGRRATVLIYDRTAVTPPTGPLRRLPEELFPTSITALDGLRGVILEREPRWQGARLRAFREWLVRGGRVYLVHSSSGEYPRFSAELEFLNQQGGDGAWGAGTVKRIPRTLAEIDLPFAQVEMFNDDQLGWVGSAGSSLRNSLLAGGMQTTYTTSDALSIWTREIRIISNLVSVARFRRNWLLIYVAVAAYLLTLWPGCYRIGRLARDFRWFYAAFFFAIVVFSILFMSLGRVGAKIQNRSRCVAIAHHLGDGAFDVKQWTTIAVPLGGTYRIQHSGSGISYANSHEFEAVLGKFNVGSEAWAEFFLPPAGTRTMIHRSRLSMNRPPPVISRIEFQDVRAIAFEADVSNTMAANPEFAALICRGMIYRLQIRGKQLSLDNRQTDMSLEEFFQEKVPLGLLTGPRFRSYEEEDDARSDRLIFEDNLLPLTAASLNISENTPSNLPAHMARLVIYARMPAEFFPEALTFPDQMGRVLYCFDIPVGSGT